MKLLINENDLENYKWKDLIPLECEICKSTFYKTKGLVRRGLKGTRKVDVCGKECWKTLLSKKVKRKTILTIPCEWCKKEFQKDNCQVEKNKRNNKKNFCSRKCVSQWTQKMGLKQISKYPKVIELICLHCGKKFIRSHQKYRDNVIKKGSLYFCSVKCRKNLYQYLTRSFRSSLEIWIEEKLTNLYPSLEIVYNDRNTIGMELDIYIPSLELSFELNGIYHYKPIYGIDKFTKVLYKDIKKEHECKTQHIDLYVLDCKTFSHLNEETDKIYLNEIVKRIEEKLGSELTELNSPVTSDEAHAPTH